MEVKNNTTYTFEVFKQTQFGLDFIVVVGSKLFKNKVTNTQHMVSTSVTNAEEVVAAYVLQILKLFEQEVPTNV